jgi:Na+-translocating ferredoxin:NAD+ oxidoreductase RNF subunit RnfB
MAVLVLSNILILGGLAVLAAVVLYNVSKKFAVEQSPVMEEILKKLPGANCGGCGKAGCQAFALACTEASEDEFKNLLCPVGGSKVMSEIAEIKGFGAIKGVKTCAVLRCQGTCQNAPDKIEYTGLKSCRIANMVMTAVSGCPNGCMRLGDCIKVCRFGALSMDKVTGMPVIDADKCTSCGACVKRCPRGLFEIRPIEKNSQVYVACRNQEKGAAARKNCSAACIACGKCTKIHDSIKIENNLSYIPTEVSPAEFGQKLADECPVKAIIYRTNILSGEKDEN